MNLREQIFWLHQFGFIEHSITKWAIDNPDRTIERFLISSRESLQRPAKLAVKLLARRSSQELQPYFEELGAIVGSLGTSYAGFGEPSLALQTILARMTSDLSELRQHRTAILRGLTYEMSSRRKEIAAAHLPDLLAWTKEWIDGTDRTPYERLIVVAGVIREQLKVAEGNELPSRARRTYMAFLVDQLPKSFDASGENIDPEVLGAIGSIFEDMLNSRDGWFTGKQLATIQFYADALAKF